MESESIRKRKIPFLCFECFGLLKGRLDRTDKWTVAKISFPYYHIYDNLYFWELLAGNSKGTKQVLQSVARIIRNRIWRVTSQRRSTWLEVLALLIVYLD